MNHALAHLSDLHFGLAPRLRDRARALMQAVARAGIDHVIVSGDSTHRGRWEELEELCAAAQPVREHAELTVVPGNHDRLGDDVASSIMGNHRVLDSCHEGLFVVRLDSTAPHNCRYPFEGHGLLTDHDLRLLDRALGRAPAGVLTVVTMHHHPFPLPEESSLERLSSWIGLPYSSELATGRELMACLRGRCDLLLHGHRHVPSERVIEDGGRPLWVFNAGSSSEMGRARVFEHREGRLVGRPRWISLPPSAPIGLEPRERPAPRWPRVETLRPPAPAA